MSPEKENLLVDRLRRTPSQNHSQDYIYPTQETRRVQGAELRENPISESNLQRGPLQQNRHAGRSKGAGGPHPSTAGRIQTSAPKRSVQSKYDRNTREAPVVEQVEVVAKTSQLDKSAADGDPSKFAEKMLARWEKSLTGKAVVNQNDKQNLQENVTLDKTPTEKIIVDRNVEQSLQGKPFETNDKHAESDPDIVRATPDVDEEVDKEADGRGCQPGQQQLVGGSAPEQQVTAIDPVAYQRQLIETTTDVILDRTVVPYLSQIADQMNKMNENTGTILAALQEVQVSLLLCMENAGGQQAGKGKQKRVEERAADVVHDVERKKALFVDFDADKIELEHRLQKVLDMAVQMDPNFPSRSTTLARKQDKAMMERLEKYVKGKWSQQRSQFLHQARTYLIEQQDLWVEQPGLLSKSVLKNVTLHVLKKKLFPFKDELKNVPEQSVMADYHHLVTMGMQLTLDMWQEEYYDRDDTVRNMWLMLRDQDSGKAVGHWRKHAYKNKKRKSSGASGSSRDAEE